MFARVTYLEGSPARAVEAVRQVRDQAVPAAQSAGGFEGVILLVDQEGGRAMTITFWSSREDLEASEEVANTLRHLPEARWAVQAVERYEVALRR
jgi:heme-degrading monooxygenase HmoA